MIELPTKCRYATRILVNIARHDSGTSVQKSQIAHDEQISNDYVAQILLKLKTAGLVLSRRGTHGGFILAKPAASITVADVVESVEGPLSIAPCLSHDCRRSPRCVTRHVWLKANTAFREALAGVTIQDLASMAKTLASADFEI